MKSLSAFGACAGVLLIVACGSSPGGEGDNDSGSGSDVGTKDVGPRTDTGSSGGDTGSSSGDTGSTSDGTSPTDTGSSDVGSSTDTGSTASCPAIGTGAKQFNVTGACGTCLATNCCATLTTCVGVAQCLDLLNCAAACDGGTSCEDSCGIKYLKGDSDAQKFGNCESAMCGSSC
jgi:hypothetical protein